jgi:hypothetical protein
MGAPLRGASRRRSAHCLFGSGSAGLGRTLRSGARAGRSGIARCSRWLTTGVWMKMPPLSDLCPWATARRRATGRRVRQPRQRSLHLGS